MGRARHFHVVFDVRVLDLNLSNNSITSWVKIFFPFLRYLTLLDMHENNTTNDITLHKERQEASLLGLTTYDHTL